MIKDGSSCPACIYCTPDTNLFIMKRKFVNQSWIFCIPVAILLRIHFSTQGKPGIIDKKILILDQLLYHVPTEETNHRYLFFHLDHVTSKHELPLSFLATVLTVLWSFMQLFVEGTVLVEFQVQHHLVSFLSAQFVLWLFNDSIVFGLLTR